MEIKILKIEDKILRFSILNGDFTVGNLIQKALLDDKRILGAGFYMAHPLTKELIFTVFYKESVDHKKAKEIILEAINKIKSDLMKLKEEVTEALKKSS